MIIPRKNIYIHAPIFRLLDRLDEFLTLKMNAEIYIISDFVDNPRPECIERINSAFDKSGLSRKIHGPFMDLNPGSPDKKIKQITLERFTDALRLCTELKADSMVLHSHYEPVFMREHFKKWLDNSMAILEDVSQDAQKRKISIYIENSLDDSTKAVGALLKAHPYFGACFDVAHHHAFNPDGWKRALEGYPQGSIKEVHLSDNNGDEDAHLPLGTGSINFEEFFAEIEKRGEGPVFTIEPHAPEDLVISLEFMKRFMDGD
ncbi:MAG: sugar phosphate isomerase/epimerase [Candidatus Omnitrophica bacterium]|nr:sugar phosphate isomerase/epimerase [Candidatus Omnitrophota bacterium]